MKARDDQTTLRQAFKAAMRRQAQRQKALLAAGTPRFALAQSGLFDDLSGFAVLRCGAQTRSGTLCKRKDIYSCGRCRLHGGLSTGPKTPAGKSISRQNGLRPKRTP